MMLLGTKTAWICLAAVATTSSFLAAPTANALVTPRPLSAPRGGAVSKAGNRNPVVAPKSSGVADAEASQGDGTATIPNEVFNLVKSIVGAGVLSLPYGIAAFGNAPSALLPGCALIAIMGAISAYTFGLIGRVCQSTNTDSYADAWDATVGKSTSSLIAFSCFFDCLMGNLRYVMSERFATILILCLSGLLQLHRASLLLILFFEFIATQ
jgi:hypothetical protein